MTEEAKAPDSNTDWKAIDIYVFSNGQQYSPPRKYHFRSSELNLWKSTLKFVAKTQYGPFEASIVDLYTLDGTKLTGPLELCNGASYVAVAPPDAFVKAGYEKYLIRASRSWEKRQAKRTENIQSLDKPLTEIEPNDVKVRDTYNMNKSEESTILKTIASSMANTDSSVIVKPQATLAFLRKRNPPSALTGKPRSSNQRSSLIKKNNPLVPATSSLKGPPKKNDSVKTSNFKTTKPEGDKCSSLASGSGQDRSSIKSKMFKTTIKSRASSASPEVAVLKVHKMSSDLKQTSVKKISNEDKKLSTNNIELKDVIENKEIVLISNIYQNPRGELPSIAVEPIISIHEPIKQKAMITVTDNPSENVQENSDGNSNFKISTTVFNVPNIINPSNSNEEYKISINENVVSEKVLFESNPEHSVTRKAIEEIVSGNETKISIAKSNEHISILELPSQKQLLEPEKLSNKQNESHNTTEKVTINSNNDNIMISATKSNEAIKFHNSLPPKPSVYVEKTHSLISNENGKSSKDQYVAVLNKGDVVNLKFNIEIENREGSLTKYNNSSTLYTEKGSQINIDELIIAQNKSLLSVIGKEIKDHYVGDNHHVVIVQDNGCKYCNEQRILEKNAIKSYVVILPLEIVEGKTEGCYCNQTLPPILRQASLQNLVTTTRSCLCEEKTNPNKIASKTSCIPDKKISENSVKDVASVATKKSVAINEEIKASSKEVSMISICPENITLKSQCLVPSAESMEIHSKVMVDETTQTEWCQVLLEARLLEDGHYTFHLPALEVLKFYRLA